ncbi:hypothetical protein LV89_01862 [Arcicella aurantiaca]|uniref:PKD/Chitinase domain-containing protein n=1 Tax=Arcicella aurantiaca TaxID=591202 RepID=A0A316E971_9BACT|nr:PKD domain-containing protein [Arcicella aurantiaca]PWK27050.1 hypothetical protein LV89_01862 [Arcicella aurantiaca]
MKKITLLFLLIAIALNSCKTKDATPAPKAEFTYTINDEGLVNFRSVSTNATTTEWLIDNSKKTSTSFDYQFSRNGNYQVSLTAKDASGQSDVVVKSIPINNRTASLTIYRAYPTGKSTVTVTLDNKYSGLISGEYYFSSTPDCGNVYSASFNKLQAGSHSYFCKEILTGATWSGTVNVTGGVCHFVSLIK